MLTPLPRRALPPISAPTRGNRGGVENLGHPRPKIAIGSHRAATCSQQAQSPGRLAALSPVMVLVAHEHPEARILEDISLMRTRRPSIVDKHVGARSRVARMEAGKSQTQVAEALVLQQLQKYEKGTNRISAGKLHEMSRLFDRPVQFFFDGLGVVAGGRGSREIARSIRSPASAARRRASRS